MERRRKDDEAERGVRIYKWRDQNGEQEVVDESRNKSRWTTERSDSKGNAVVGWAEPGQSLGRHGNGLLGSRSAVMYGHWE